MRSKGFIVKRLITKAVFGGMLLATAKAYADAPAPKWYDTIAASGYLQTSYVGNPQYSGNNKTNQGRQFDTNGNTFSLNTFLLQIAKPVGDDHYGFTTRLRTGTDAQALNNASKGTTTNNVDFAVQEAYLTYVVPSASKLSFIGGRFVTPEGYEVIDTVSNPNFSEGLLFTWLEPLNHTGIKANYMFNDKVNATIGLVNGVNVEPDNNSAKSILWQIATAPVKNLAWSLQGYYGKELADAPTTTGHSAVTSIDTVATYAMGKLSLAGQLNWGQQSNDPATSAGQGTTHWSGAGVWATFAETDKCSTSARFEVLEDNNNANRMGVVGTPYNGTTNQTVKEFTVTQKHMLTTTMGVRAEYRHDFSTQAYFVRKDGSAVRNQNTYSADWFVTF
jgi:hypothetical protein